MVKSAWSERRAIYASWKKRKKSHNYVILLYYFPLIDKKCFLVVLKGLIKCGTTKDNEAYVRNLRFIFPCQHRICLSMLRKLASSSSMLLCVHRDYNDCYGRGALDGHLDCSRGLDSSTAPEVLTGV